jgi:hypothetical protein
LGNLANGDDYRCSRGKSTDDGVAQKIRYKAKAQESQNYVKNSTYKADQEDVMQKFYCGVMAFKCLANN